MMKEDLKQEHPCISLPHAKHEDMHHDVPEILAIPFDTFTRRKSRRFRISKQLLPSTALISQQDSGGAGETKMAIFHEHQHFGLKRSFAPRERRT
jgi:hypothetical protein